MTTQTLASASSAPPSQFGRAASVAWMCAAGLLVLGLCGLAAVLRPEWASKPELADRILIPIASMWLLWNLRAVWIAAPSRPAPWGWLFVLAGSALFALAWFLIVQVHQRVALLWLLTLGYMAAAFGTAVMWQGWGRAKLLLFPLLFNLFALPPPGRLIDPLQLRLKDGMTAMAATVLPWLGISVQRDGYMLELPGGTLGMADACSGVRSLAGLMAIAALVAFVKGFGWLRSAVLLAATLAIVAVSNAVRIVVSGVLQESLGRAAIEGWAHEALGISVILVGLVLVVAVANLLARRESQSSPPGSPVFVPAGRGGWLAAATLAAALAGCIWSEQFRQAKQELAPLSTLSQQLGHWTGRELDVPHQVAEMLVCDQIVHRAYVDPIGQEVNVWVMFWANAGTTTFVHHPDICYPRRGWQVKQAGVHELPVGEARLPVTVRHYSRPDQQQVLFFWRQQGDRVLDENAQAADGWLGYEWIWDVVTNRRPDKQGAFITVLIGTETRGSPEVGETALKAFAAAFAAELYRVCPWAAAKR